MKTEIEFQSRQEDLEMVVLRLGKLIQMIDSICLGMIQENIERQAVDCLECVRYCVNDIRNMALEGMQESEIKNTKSVERKHL